MGRAVLIVALVLGLSSPAAAQDAQGECSPDLTVVMAEGQVLQVGFTGLSESDQLREVRIHTTPESDALAEPDQGLIWQVRSSSGLGTDPVVVKVPEAPVGMTVPVPLEGPLPDEVTVIVVLLGPDGRSMNIPEHVDVASLRQADPATATVDFGCGDDPGGELGSIMKSIGVGAVLFILGVSALLFVLNILLVGLRRAIFGSAR